MAGNNDRQLVTGGQRGDAVRGRLPVSDGNTPTDGRSSRGPDLERELTVLDGLARLLVALLPVRSAITQNVLDHITAGWNELHGVSQILMLFALQPAGPEEVALEE